MKTNSLLTELKKGRKIFFSNKNYLNSNNDIKFVKLRLELVQNRISWANGFKIYFNGQLVQQSKTFESFKKRLNILTKKWHLEQIKNI